MSAGATWQLQDGLIQSLSERASLGPAPKRAIFLDRDGTLIQDRGYLANANGVVLLPGVAPALRQLSEAGFGLVIVSNQSGVARGLLTTDALREVHGHMLAVLEAEGVVPNGAWYCTHGPAAGCACRKPKPGMLQRAAQELALDLRACWMIGDKDSDTAAGIAAGCRGLGLNPATPDLTAAAALILAAKDRT